MWCSTIQRWLGRLFGILLVALISGCGGGSGPAITQTNLHDLAVFYGRFTSQHQGRAPANETEFKNFLRQNSKLLEERKITDMESLFRSPRDQQPYTIIYGLKSGSLPPPPQRPPIIAHEKVGQRGKLLAAFLTGAVEDLNETELKEVLGKSQTTK